MISLNKRTLLKGLAAGAAFGVIGNPAVRFASAQEKPQRGGQISIGYALEPTGLDSHTARSGGDYYYIRSMHDNLIFLDRSGTPDPTRSLAERWEVATEPHSFTLFLRKGVQFHDGTPFNAEAAKFNLDRILDPNTKATANAAMKPVTGVEVIDEYTIRINLSAPWAAGIRQLSAATVCMVSPAAVKASGPDYAWKPVGTGAFKLVEAVPGSFVRVVRNENYWLKDKDGEALPYLDQITWRVIKDDAVMAAALRSGEIDLCYAPPAEVGALQGDDRFYMDTFEGAGVANLILFNTALAPTDNKHLRRAIGHAVSGDAINKAAYFGRGTVADAGMWPPSHWAYQKSEAKPMFDLAKAKEELAAGGMPDGFELSVVTWNGVGLPRAAEVFQAMCAQVGIKANIQVLTVGTANDMFFLEKKTHIYFTAWSVFPDPDREMSWMVKTGGFYNAGKDGWPEADALIDQGAAEYDQEKRKEIYHKLAEIQLGEAKTLPFVYRNTYATAAKRVQNLTSVFDAEAIMNVKDLWVKA